jgi:hypothetical protein
MRYDANYQNEQAHSPYFREHLEQIVDSIKDLVPSRGKIVEIGCGKGFFLEKLQKKGFKVKGFDPAYEGYNPDIIKDYFSQRYLSMRAELIILRHVLEHVGEPLRFLHYIAKINNYEGKIFIEVPCFKWIIQKKAFWDIFYEHCNYFTGESLSSIFVKSQIGHFFNGQYLYVSAELEYLRKRATAVTEMLNTNGDVFTSTKSKYQNFIMAHPGIVVWGAGAKGTTFVNLMDPNNKYISAVIDINPKKQNTCIAKSGHEIVAPEQLNKLKPPAILIMNNNYRSEIANKIKKRNLKTNLFALGEL